MSKAGKGKIVWILLGSTTLIGGVVLGGLFFTYDPELVAGQSLKGKVLTGNRSQALKGIETWFDEYKSKPIELSGKQFGEAKYTTSLEEMGCTVDPQKLAQGLAYKEFFKNLIGGYKDKDSSTSEVDPNIQCTLDKADEVAKFVEENHPEIGKAKASYKDGQIQLVHEQVSMELDEEKLEDALLATVDTDVPGQIPVKHAPKNVPDEELERITTVMSEFKTTFSAGNVSRSANVRLAASQIDGVVLLPGESFSFNDHLGRRTTEKGFKVAGVYVSGRHDFDVGGGICQVSTTLYNAAIRSDLKIPVRYSHSLPVPYVPLGQDAAVSFPNPDLKITNSYDFPIALSATPEKSTITFRILGEKKPEYTYKFESKLISSWDRGEKVVHDPSLKYGVRKVVDRGGSGRKVRTWRLTYKDGELVEKAVLNDSTYSGGPRIVAVNKSAKPAVKPPTESVPVSNPGN